MHWAQRTGRHIIVGALVASAALAVAQAPPAVVEVETGDTFSGIASRFTGSTATWRKLYRPELSGLADPNRIYAGMRFEVLADASGEQYLRLLAPAHATTRVAQALPRRAAPAPAPAPASLAEQPGKATAPSSGASAALGGKPLVIGVLPNIGAAALTTNYARMKRYLERRGDHTVTIVVPRNFKEFFDSTMRGDYDLAIAAPHFARIAQVDRNMTPILTYQPQINGLFIAANESTVKEPRDVRERVVAFANPQSLVAMYGSQWLKQAGLEPGADYEVRGARTDLGVGRMLLSGDVVAAIMSNGEFRALPPDEASRLKVVEIFAKIPNFIFMAHPRVEGARLARLKAQLLGFFADAEEGAPFAQASGFTGIVDVDPASMRALDPFVDATRRSMGTGP